MEVLLERDQPVDITLDGGWQLTARVASVGLEHVDLGPVDTPLTLPAQLRWCGATITWKTRIGAAHRRGVLVNGPADTLRLHPVGDPMKVQRRQFVRVPCELSTAVIAPDKRLTTRTLDVSVGGMLVAPADTLVLDDIVRFALDLGTITIAGDGRVVRGTSAGARGILFADLQGRAERQLSRFVAQRQRELIAGAQALPED
ncbi:MAG TPA: PilZ domain-containing protein [Baekduia sp.]|nr:PilZ domain-containing protein [Baekduia sp.]